MMDDSSDLSDMSQLTQVPKKEYPTFKILDTSDSEDEDLLVVGDYGNQNVNLEDAVNLEDGKLVSTKRLYDDVFCEDISLDENIDGM